MVALVTWPKGSRYLRLHYSPRSRFPFQHTNENTKYIQCSLVSVGSNCSHPQTQSISGRKGDCLIFAQCLLIVMSNAGIVGAIKGAGLCYLCCYMQYMPKYNVRNRAQKFTRQLIVLVTKKGHQIFPY